jgi:2-polyprenyl-6-methoxyphenol hydroxylase-like FAD-dependent oxidoreductase
MRVVVVGAGPAGASLALTLARAGIATTLLEAATNFNRELRGEALMPSGLEALGALGLTPIAAAVPQRALAGWAVAVQGRLLFELDEPLGASDEPACTLVNQTIWLEQLLCPAARPSSLTLLTGQPVKQLLRDDNSAARISGVTLATGQQLQADLVVACDGRASLLRRQAGLALIGQDSPIDVLWFRYAETPTAPPLAGRFLTLVGDEGIGSLFCNASGQVQLGWVIDHRATTPVRSAAEWSARLASQAPPPLASWLLANADYVTAPVRLSVQVGMAERWWQPGLVLLGDAAHPMSPVRAQGINAALRDAAVAARQLIELAQTLAPGASPPPAAIDASLAAIEAERRPEVNQLQILQAEEMRRGELLRQTPALRCLLAATAPLLGGLIGRRWRSQQLQLRQGINRLTVQP